MGPQPLDNIFLVSIQIMVIFNAFENEYEKLKTIRKVSIIFKKYLLSIRASHFTIAALTLQSILTCVYVNR